MLMLLKETAVNIGMLCHVGADTEEDVGGCQLAKLSGNMGCQHSCACRILRNRQAVHLRCNFFKADDIHGFSISPLLPPASHSIRAAACSFC